MSQEAVMNPIAGEADYQVDILHRPYSVPCQPALEPIGQDGGPGSKSTWYRERFFAAESGVCYVTYGISSGSDFAHRNLLVRWVGEKTASESELRGDGGSRFRCGPPK
jgi:hypothetical protein